VQLRLETEKSVPMSSVVHSDGACGGDDDDSSQVQLPGHFPVHVGGDACGGRCHGPLWGPLPGSLPPWKK
jgi:hypothetical protein